MKDELPLELRKKLPTKYSNVSFKKSGTGNYSGNYENKVVSINFHYDLNSEPTIEEYTFSKRGSAHPVSAIILKILYTLRILKD